MRFGRVVGKVWCSVSDPGLQGQRLLVVQPLTPALAPTGKPLVCTDCTGAGAGELVYWCGGMEAAIPYAGASVPTDNTVVGVIDQLHIEKPS